MVFTVVVENVLAKLSDVIPRVDDMIEREHRAELLRLYDQFFKNQEEKECDEGDVRNELVEIIRRDKMMREDFFLHTKVLSLSKVKEMRYRGLCWRK
jgi:rubrerythrin